MPYLAPALSTPTDPGPVDPGTGGHIPNPPVVTVVPRLTITIITSDGTVFDLSDPSRMLAVSGRKGFDSPTYEVYEDESPGAPGSIYRGQRALSRDIILPVWVEAASRPEFLDLRRGFLGKLSRGLNTLVVAESNGTRRFIDFSFSGRGAEGEGQWTRWTRYLLELRCHMPYWRGDPLRVRWDAPDPETFLPILPLKVQSSQTFGATSFINPGDVDCSPVWTIEGPASGITLTRTTLDPTQTLTLTATLTAGQTRVIDTRPGRLSVVDQAGVNRFAEVQAGTWPWVITPGENLLEVSIGGFNENTAVTLEAEPLYETA